MPFDTKLVTELLHRKNLPFLVWVTAFWKKFGLRFDLLPEPFIMRNYSHYPNVNLVKWHKARCLGC